MFFKLSIWVDPMNELWKISQSMLYNNTLCIYYKKGVNGSMKQILLVDLGFLVFLVFLALLVFLIFLVYF